MTENQFQKYVLEHATKQFPNISFFKGNDTLTLKTSTGFQIGLPNIYRIYCQNPTDTSLINSEIDNLINSIIIKNESSIDSIAWDKAKNLLRPQFMPREYLDQMSGLINIPFSTDVNIGFVIDGEKSYSYIREKDIQKWHKTIQDICEQSIHNLDSLTKGIQLSVMAGPSKVVMINSGDGFDAARILLPKFRRMLNKHVGSNFTFALPNRDFLICWASNAPPEFSEQLHAKIRKDFQSENHPLSPELYMTDKLPTEFQ